MHVQNVYAYMYKNTPEFIVKIVYKLHAIVSTKSSAVNHTSGVDTDAPSLSNVRRTMGSEDGDKPEERPHSTCMYMYMYMYALSMYVVHVYMYVCTKHVPGPSDIIRSGPISINLDMHMYMYM